MEEWLDQIYEIYLPDSLPPEVNGFSWEGTVCLTKAGAMRTQEEVVFSAVEGLKFLDAKLYRYS